jgi:hypothetical protein
VGGGLEKWGYLPQKLEVVEHLPSSSAKPANLLVPHMGFEHARRFGGSGRSVKWTSRRLAPSEKAVGGVGR